MASIYYDPEGYTTKSRKLMGRHAAGESFLKGYILYSTTPELMISVDNDLASHDFLTAATKLGCKKPIKKITKENYGAHESARCLYIPGPGIGETAYKRSAFGHSSWSLCGITHTTSSAGAMDSIVDLINAPVMPWDAVICTSTAVKKHVTNVMQSQLDYLKERFGISKFVEPQLPIIPLGVHSQDFSYTEDEKDSSRKKLGIDSDTIVVLYMGRLSFHAKAHPFAMYQALQKARSTTAKSVTLIECGWYPNDEIQKSFHEGAILACPDVKVVQLDGRDAENRKIAWSASDVFCSLSDNIQETFGITPIEAMAAGIPVVVSDWDGYRDTVRDGVDGFTVPTRIPPAGSGGDFALRHAIEIDTYDRYCGFTCTMVEVDIEATAEAFIKLFTNTELRKKMGESGKKRAQSVYDWKTLIPTYEELWSELFQIRSHEKKSRSVWPARLDPFTSFSHYATEVISEQIVVSLTDINSKIAISRYEKYLSLGLYSYSTEIALTLSEVEPLLNKLNDGSSSIEHLIQNVLQPQKMRCIRGIVNLMKMGIIKRAKQ